MRIQDPEGRVAVTTLGQPGPGRRATAVLGVVTGTAILGTNILKDVMASIRDVVGGRAKAYERTLEEAQAQAVADLCREAEAAGADTVLDLRIDVEVAGEKGGMLGAQAMGTAVSTERTG